VTEDSFPSKVYLLANRIIEETTSYIDSGKAREVTKEYTTLDFHDFSYKPFGVTCSVEFLPQEKEVWDEFDQLEFIRNVIENLKEYEEVQAAIPQEYPDSKRNPLSNFAYTVVSRVYDGTIDDTLSKYIPIFINDLKNGPVKWMCKSWLTGIWLDERPYEILPQLKLRRPEPTDLEEEWLINFDVIKQSGFSRTRDPLSLAAVNRGSIYGYLRTSHNAGTIFHQIVPKLSAIMELCCRERDRREPWHKLALILDCLAFFGTGAAFPIKSELKPISFVEAPTSPIGPAETPLEFYKKTPFQYRYLSDYYQYTLENSDIPKLAEFIRAMRRAYPEEGIVYSLKFESPVRVAFYRYQGAFLSQASGLTGQIASSIMALEALLLKDSEKVELTHKLSQRTSALMGFFGWETISVFQDAKKVLCNT
jgi:hypothetical protein